MTAYLIDIPDDLMEQVRQVAVGATKSETVCTALRLLVRLQRQHDAITWFAGHRPFDDQIGEESCRQPPS